MYQVNFNKMVTPKITPRAIYKFRFDEIELLEIKKSGSWHNVKCDHTPEGFCHAHCRNLLIDTGVPHICDVNEKFGENDE